MRIIDVSFPLEEGMPAFPGDPPVRIDKERSMGRGDPYDLSLLSIGSHAGTHVDPPSHFIPGGAGVDRLDLSVLNGPCRVVQVDARAEVVRREDIARVPTGATRVLFHTGNSERWATTGRFFSDFAALDADAARTLVERGVRLVGIDSLSVERDRTGAFPVHHVLLGAGVLILEGLRLAGAPEGDYELRCLPLRIVSGDGGPCRAILIEP